MFTRCGHVDIDEPCGVAGAEPVRCEVRPPSRANVLLRLSAAASSRLNPSKVTRHDFIIEGFGTFIARSLLLAPSNELSGGRVFQRPADGGDGQDVGEGKQLLHKVER